MRLQTEIDGETLQDLIGLHTRLYAPLTGFMTSLDYENVVNNMRLSDQSVWTLPITLDVSHAVYKKALDAKRLHLTYRHRDVGIVEIHDCFRVSAQRDVKKIFKTDDIKHPGVKKELARAAFRIGGKTWVTNKALLKTALNPNKTKRLFTKRGWKTVVGFQTRNPIHTAHEHLQRVGLDICDGLFVNPSVGWKKQGDFSEEAIMTAYKCMIEQFYPEDRVYVEGLRIYFRYAGPREAIFHAIIRRNLGCTHFIIGRDHAGVGGYYGTYEAHDLAAEIMKENNLGIELLLLNEPYFCNVCDKIVTQKHCRHRERDIVRISGGMIRSILRKGKFPDARFMRPEVTKAIMALRGRAFVQG